MRHVTFYAILVLGFVAVSCGTGCSGDADEGFHGRVPIEVIREIPDRMKEITKEMTVDDVIRLFRIDPKAYRFALKGSGPDFQYRISGSLNAKYGLNFLEDHSGSEFCKGKLLHVRLFEYDAGEGEDGTLAEVDFRKKKAE
jgi:hypothetical protein